VGIPEKAEMLCLGENAEAGEFVVGFVKPLVI